MPRAPFDTTATFFQGPGGASPGSIRFFGPARFVLADAISQVGDGAPHIVGWVTTESGVPVPAWNPSPFGSRPSLADQVAIAAGEPEYWVVYVERVQWLGADYYRASLAELPLPDECDCGTPPPPDGHSCEAALLLDGEPYPAGDYTYPLDSGEHVWVLVDGGPTGGFVQSNYVGRVSLYTTECDYVAGPGDPSWDIPAGFSKVLIENPTGISSDGFSVVWV